MSRRLVVSFVNRLPVHGLKGSAQVIDGETMVINEERIRVDCIYAPELDQVFWSRGKWLTSGPMAMAAMSSTSPIA